MHSPTSLPLPQKTWRLPFWPTAVAPRLALLAILVLTAALAALQLSSPAVVPATASATEFSAERAMRHIAATAREPHPLGSPEHEATAQYILTQVRALGLTPVVQEEMSVKYDSGQVHAARIKNIIARIPGTANTGALFLASHYDSMPTTHAAADGGISTAVLLETARAVLAGPPLKNDVILYFGDSDVNAVLGARAFYEHPWATDVRVGFAFEGVGVEGPSGLVYTTPDNGWWLDQALPVLPHPTLMLTLNEALGSLAPMLSPEVYLAVGEKREVALLGFGQARGGYAYHTMLDRPDRLDPRAVQQHGGYALALVRRFGALPLDRPDQLGAPNLIAFNILPGRVVAYPSTWAMPLAGLVTLLLVGVLGVGLRRQYLTVRGLVVGLVLFVLSLPTVLIAAIVAGKLATAVNPVYRAWFQRGWYGADWHLLYLLAVAVAAVTTLYLAGRRLLPSVRNDDNMAAGALVGLALLMVLTTFTIPTLSYLFTWTTLAGGLLLSWAVLAPNQAQHPWPRALALAVAGLVPLTLFALPVYLLYTFLASPFWAMLMPVSLEIIAPALAALALAGLLPQLQFLGGQRRWAVPLMCLALAVGALAGEVAAGRFDASQPRTNYIQYTLDHDTGVATWTSDGRQPDRWTAQFFRDGYAPGQAELEPYYNLGMLWPVIQAPAPVVDLPAPQVAVIEDVTQDGRRSLRLRLTSPRGATYLRLESTLPGDLVTASVGDRLVTVADIPPADRRRFGVMLYNLAPEGVEIRLTIQGSGPIEARLTDYSHELPTIPDLTVEPRPPEFTPTPHDFRDPTIVHKSFKF